MGTNIYNPSKNPVQLIYVEQNAGGKALDNWNEGDRVSVRILPQHKNIGVKHVPVQSGKTYLIRLSSKPSVTGTDNATYTYECINALFFHRNISNVSGVNLPIEEIECHYTKSGSYIKNIATSYTGTRTAADIGYLETDFGGRVRIVNANDRSSSNSPISKGEHILGDKTDAVYVTILSDTIKYLTVSVSPKDTIVHGIVSQLPNPTTTVMTELQGGLIIEEVEEIEVPQSFIKGDDVANATSYELFEKNADGSYKSWGTSDHINFEVSALGLSAGNHTFVVKAKADGYEDSDYSNEVTATIE